MIISEKYKYVFIEIPRTGCTAISNELKELYDGKSILEKHAHYKEFLTIASYAEKNYFTFSGIRNPMDSVVSRYFKLKTGQQNPNWMIDRAIKKRKINTSTTRKLLAQYNFIHKHNADFSSYFLKFYKTPYNDRSLLNHKDLDYIIKFENLADNFNNLLNLLGIVAQRELPMLNKTKEKDHNYISYYLEPRVMRRAIRVFGPFMEDWDYSFPKEFGKIKILFIDKLIYKVLNLFRYFYLVFFHRY